MDSADDQFKVAKGTFALAESKGEEFILGEVDGEAELSTIDATYILRAANESTKEHGDALKKIVLSEALEDIPAGKTINLGEVDGDAIEENVTTVDATYVLRFANESTKATGYAGKTVIATAAE